MKPISSRILKKFMTLAGDQLQGHWVIIGGAIMPLLDEKARVTIDIDIAGPASATQSDTLKIMAIAEGLGLPVEAINQAGAFFLHKIKTWEEDLVLLHAGRTASFFRPNVTLFLLLKLQRFTETDAADCLTFLKVAPKLGETVDIKRVSASITSQLKSNKSIERQLRLEAFANSLKNHCGPLE